MVMKHSYRSVKEYLLNSLIPVQNNTLRISTGASRSSSIKCLNVFSGTKPAEKYRNSKLLNYLVTVATSPQNPLYERTSALFDPESSSIVSFIVRAKTTIAKYDISD